MDQRELLTMLTYRRPASSRTELEFIKRYLDVVPGMYADKYGNRILTNPDSRVMIACHTDTVHRQEGRQRVRVAGGVAGLRDVSKTDSNCLGADDTAGVYAALRLIEAKVPATFVFHREEEIGGRGSTWLAYNYPEWIGSFDVCLSLDRRGTRDIITSQWGGRCASDAFAWSLADALDMGHRPDPAGIFTDSANYAELIPECSNLSIGYEHEHTQRETLDLVYLERVIERLCKVNWTSLVIERDPSVSEELAGEWDDDWEVMFPGAAPCDLCGTKERSLKRVQFGYYLCSECVQYEWEEDGDAPELSASASLGKGATL